MQFKKVSSSRPNRFITIFRLEKHFWAHPLLLKHVFTFTNFFWNLLVLDTTKLYAFVSSPLTFFIYLCYLHPWPCSIWVKNHHAFCYLNICATFPQSQQYFLYSICTSLNQLYIIRWTNYLTLRFGNWWWMERSQ